MSIILDIIYLISIVTFILGLKYLGHPETARKGNLIAAAGMGLAIIGTLVLHERVSNFIYILIFVAILIGTVIGWLMAVKVKMTKMPELVSLFNGFGGASALLIGLIEFNNHIGDATQTAITISAVVIGSITFSGSLVAWAKLDGIMKGLIRLPKYNLINNLVILGIIAFSTYVVYTGSDSQLFLYLLLAVSLFYGVLFVIPIGGADMPVVISLLNSLTGISAAIAGAIYGNMVMIVGGILVGSAGLILTVAMCKAMNELFTTSYFCTWLWTSSCASATCNTRIRAITYK